MKVIILAGGKGTRLWPLSREKYSKQFLKLVDNVALIEASYERALKIAKPEDIVTITNNDYYFYTKEISDKFSEALSDNIITEPVGKNTAPAIALSVEYLIDKLETSPDDVVFVFTSDHIIKPLDKFVEYMEIANDTALKGYLVTFGIKPTKPETGYGYIKVGESLGKFSKVENFTEKPNLETAKEYLKDGRYYWNSGMFAFKISTFLEELKIYETKIFENIQNGFDVARDNFKDMPSISIDYAIMEKSKKVAVVPMDIFWSDVGSWDSFYENGLYISYLGSARKENGFKDVVNFVFYCQNNKINYKFLMQVNSSVLENEKDLERVIIDLKSANLPNVELIERDLTTEEYLSCIRRSSILLLLYEPKRHSTSISGILLESFLFGKPVIVKSGSWLAKQVTKHGGGVIVEDIYPESIRNAVERIKLNYERYYNEALAAGVMFSKRHNGLELAKLITDKVNKGLISLTY